VKFQFILRSDLYNRAKILCLGDGDVDTTASNQDAIAQRWLAALLRSEATLPCPVASAIVENVVKGPLGDSLRQLEQALIHLESLRAENLTGSEARAILAILVHLNDQVAQLQTRIRRLWDGPP
jgi:hypothetical protein